MTRLRLWPITAVTPQLGCQLWVGKHVLKLPREGDVTEFFPFLSFNEALSVARWALAHFLEGLTENAAVVHACANHLRLWDCHEMQSGNSAREATRRTPACTRHQTSPVVSMAGIVVSMTQRSDETHQRIRNDHIQIHNQQRAHDI